VNVPTHIKLFVVFPILGKDISTSLPERFFAMKSSNGTYYTTVIIDTERDQGSML